MKAFDIVVKLLTILAIISDDEDRYWKKLSGLVLRGILFLISISAIISSSFQINKYMRTDLEETLYGIFQAAAASIGVLIMILTYLYRENLEWIFQQLQNAYDKSISSSK